ncbi:DUF2510 domain-containing protein [Stomatohabitans albus]|uniref:DUF2510 domain-containing protein n=1 Tax=Stomatohabitans albus TaxID=3110766 RepID=UPI00300C5878
MEHLQHPKADWYADPSGKYSLRYWDGATWTGHVSTNGSQEWDDPADAPKAWTSSTDPNVQAVYRAGIDEDVAQWLQAVADQVDQRLDLVATNWRQRPQPETIRACAYGLLLGHLATMYPLAEQQISLVAESHASFVNIPAGNRLGTFKEVAADPARTASWLGPMLGTGEPEAVVRLFADGD